MQNLEQLKKEAAAIMPAILEKVQQDAKLKAEFIADPQAVIRRETGHDLAPLEGFHWVVIDKSDPTALYLTIPTNYDNLELSEAELEAVAGGLASFADNVGCANIICW